MLTLMKCRIILSESSLLLKKIDLEVSRIQELKGTAILTQMNLKCKCVSKLQSAAKRIKIKYMFILKKNIST